MDLHRSGEDYLETMLILEQKKGWIRSSDVARYLKVSRASVSYAVRFLRDGGFLTMDDDRLLCFTDLGRQVAEAVYERHCILREALLLLGADPEIAEQDACLIEHDISDHTLDKLKLFLEKQKESGEQ